MQTYTTFDPFEGGQIEDKLRYHRDLIHHLLTAKAWHYDTPRRVAALRCDVLDLNTDLSLWQEARDAAITGRTK